MSKFIELHGLYNTDGIDYEGLGLPVENAKENAKPLRTLINLDNVTEVNDADEGITIEFVNGERYLFAEDYNEVKDKIDANGK